MRPRRRPEGSLVLREPPATILFGVVFTLLAPALGVRILVRGSGTASWGSAMIVPICLLLVGVMGWRLLLSSLRHVVVSVEGITLYPPFRQPVNVEWRQIEKVTFSSSRNCFTIHSDGGTVPIPTTSKNAPSFVRILADRLEPALYREAVQALTERVD